jgi:N-acetylneuraminic acid mutarotase
MRTAGAYDAAKMLGVAGARPKLSGVRPPLILILIAVVIFVLVPLTPLVDLPGELKAKEILGVYDPDCTRVDGDGPDGDWRSETPLPSQRDEPRAVNVDGLVYLAGGLRSIAPPAGRSVARFESFDPRSGRYERLPDMPLALDHLGLAAIGRNIYALGGDSASAHGFEASARAFRYSIDRRRWTELPSMENARGAHGIAVIGSRIYVIGGRPVREFGRVRNVATTEAFDTRTNRWQELSDMPDPREHLAAAALGDAIYVFGGRRPDGSVSSRLDRYDPASDHWTRLADAPLATSGIALLPVGGDLWTAGGEEPHQVKVFGTALAYQPSADRWTTMPNLPGPLHGYAATVLGRRVYLFTGSTCAGFSPTNDTWSSTPPVP